MRKKCLVLGADGFEGSHLVDDLLLRGFNVRAFDTFKDGKAKYFELPQEGLEIFSGSFLDAKSVDKAVQGVDFVFHSISLGSPAIATQDPKLDIKNNVIGTINLLEACVEHSVKRIIYRSSGGAVYGEVKNGYADENHMTNPIAPYAINKLCIEQYLAYYKRCFHLDYIVFRLSNPYGERQSIEGDYGVIPILLRKVLCKETIDIYGDSVRDYIYIKDVTRLIAESFYRNHTYDIYNLGSGKESSLSDILAVIESVTHIKPKINRLKKRKFDVERIALDINRIQQEFGFAAPVDLVEGIKITFDAIRKTVGE